MWCAFGEGWRGEVGGGGTDEGGGFEVGVVRVAKELICGKRGISERARCGERASRNVPISSSGMPMVSATSKKIS